MDVLTPAASKICFPGIEAGAVMPVAPNPTSARAASSQPSTSLPGNDAAVILSPSPRCR